MSFLTTLADSHTYNVSKDAMPTAVDIAADLATSEFWYVHADNETFGPFTPSQMETLADQGRLSNDTLIAPAGSGSWLNFEQLVRIRIDPPTPSELSALVGVEPHAAGGEVALGSEGKLSAEEALPSYEEAHPEAVIDETEAVIDETEARNRAAMAMRTVNEPTPIKRVRVDDIELIAPNNGIVLPAVCPRCGEAGTHERVERYRKSADWFLIFNILSFVPPSLIAMGHWYLRIGGFVPYLTISAIFGIRGSITMFVCDRCLRQVKTRKRVGFALLIATVVLGIVGFVRTMPILFAAALPMSLLGAVFATDKILRVKRAIKRDGKTEFRFTRGHTKFLVAVKRMYS